MLSPTAGSRLPLPATAGMTTARWRLVPVVEVPLAWLTLVQQHYRQADVEAALVDPTRSYCGDPYPHVVWQGPALLVEDGAHRIRAARLRGDETIRARVLLVPA